MRIRPARSRANPKGSSPEISLISVVSEFSDSDNKLIASETPTCCASGGTIYIFFVSLGFCFLFLPKLQNSKCKALSINSSTFTKLYTQRYTQTHWIGWSPVRPLSKMT